MEKFTSFDRSTDTITTIDQFGVTSSSDIESFIRSGKMATLSWQCKARLYPYLKGRKDIVADRGVGGGHNFFWWVISRCWSTCGGCIWPH